MAIEGVTAPTEIRKYGNTLFEVRVDGFGTMTDEQVSEYKRARPLRYPRENFAPLEA